jgi:hypothetical protein
LPRPRDRAAARRTAWRKIMLAFEIIGAIGVLLFLSALVTDQSDAHR